jgi:hypothetical protein
MHTVEYVTNINFVLHDVEEMFRLCHHNEKLAIAFRFINTIIGVFLHIVKNIRVCGNYQTFVKFISKIVGGTIMVTNVNHFYHIEDDVCFCTNYY